jgi:hypothetical protein
MKLQKSVYCYRRTLIQLDNISWAQRQGLTIKGQHDNMDSQQLSNSLAVLLLSEQGLDALDAGLAPLTFNAY